MQLSYDGKTRALDCTCARACLSLFHISKLVRSIALIFCMFENILHICNSHMRAKILAWTCERAYPFFFLHTLPFNPSPGAGQYEWIT